MDIRTCAVCKKKFDFDTSGLQGPKDVVCGEKCAKECAAQRGRRVVIHDKSDAIVAHNHTPGGPLRRHRR